MRNVFISELVNEARNNKKIILIVGDLGYNVIEPFQNEFPDRFINAGICEQNMVSMAAGLAKEGFKVFVYSIGNFPTFRAAEQIRNDVCYHNLDVTVVTVGGGVSYGNLGYSHHAIQDYGLMRLFPEMTIISPGDPNEVKACMKFIFQDKYPKYLRLRKAGEKNYTSSTEIIPGKWRPITINDPRKILLSTGYGLKISNDLVNSSTYKDFSIYTCPIWGQKFNDLQNEQLENFSEIISIEDHLIAGGFGSWLLENIANRETLRLGVLSNSIIGKVGSEDFLLRHFFIK